MKFYITRTSRSWPERKERPPLPSGLVFEPGPCTHAHGNWVIELATLEELLELGRSQDEELIVRVKNDGAPLIEIYDDYRE